MKYTDEDIILYAAEVTSMAGLLRKLNLKDAGGNYANMKRKVQRLNIDTTHWTGSAWSRDKQLKDWTDYTKVHRIKIHLIKERGRLCESCFLDSWMDVPITLEIHHIDGNRTNNSLDNLQLLCPNCHSLTDTWRNKKR